MTNMQLQQLLEKAGLDKHETSVYLSLVQNGESTAGQIARSSGVPRTYTYRVLDDLMEKGFVEERNARGIKRYGVTDFEATKRFIERQQLDLYQIHQQSHTLSAQLENLSNPQAPMALTESLKDQRGEEDFWRLMHSTITREIWVINPPDWWGNTNHSKDLEIWEKYRNKQHIWEKRLLAEGLELGEGNYVDSSKMTSKPSSMASLFLIDQYQVQVTSWEPFRALRIESQEMVELQKNIIKE